ncbi:hypothetical protein AB5J72_38260 [Streptomyces sp. CG1]|uniref:hypothetical protein n=1 Tax=Streptomyces sp. CG1 TaxID=1287523 RepID=UPI0034E1E2CE
MRAEWDDAHSDYATPARPPGPASLSETPTEWREQLEHGTPNGWLLRGNTMLKTLASGRPIHLMHTTAALDAIRASGQLYAAAGCLVGSLYCAPLSPEPTGLRPHNMGAYLLETKQNRDGPGHRDQPRRGGAGQGHRLSTPRPHPPAHLRGAP